MTGVIDSKICNIFSLTNMLKKIGADYKIIQSPNDFSGVDKIILPGVGAYQAAMKNLDQFGLITPIKDFAKSGKHILGICLGLQLLFDSSEEFGNCEGLGLIPGKIVKIKNAKILPHMGWNNLNILNDNDILKNVAQGADVYFVHSYCAETDIKYIKATTDYSQTITAVVGNGNVFGTQFHPEKSQKWGEIILNNFLNL